MDKSALYNKNSIRKMLDYRILGNAILSYLQKGRVLNEAILVNENVSYINDLAIKLFKAINEYILINRYHIDDYYKKVSKASKKVSEEKISYFYFLNNEYLDIIGSDIDIIFPNKKQIKNNSHITEKAKRAERIIALKKLIAQYTEELTKLEQDESKGSSVIL